MGRTFLYILIGASVVGALVVLLLITPVPEQPNVTPELPAVDSTATQQPEPVDISTMDEAPADTAEAPPVGPVTQSAAVTPSIDGTIVSGEYAHKANTAGVDVYWSNDAQVLYVGLVSPGTGYVAIGFDPDRQMEGANFILASVHEGVLTIQDQYGHETFAHMDDTARGGQDNILAAAGNEWPDQTVVEFTIPLSSGDSSDKPLLPGHAYTILVSYHSMLDDFSTVHTRRGSGTMQLDLP